MGKRIIQQRRGRGSKTYRVRRQAYRYKFSYPKDLSGKGKVIKLLNSAGQTTPIAKIEFVQENKINHFYIPASNGMYVGQEISFDGNEISNGNILKLENIPIGTKVYAVESIPGNGGNLVRSGGCFAVVSKKLGEEVAILLPSKKEKRLKKECRAIIGICAGDGRLEKPFIKAGAKYYLQKAKNKLWPRTSAGKMNAIDHPFGSGRGKVPKSRIAKRNSAPGQKVGLLRPRRTGKRK